MDLKQKQKLELVPEPEPYPEGYGGVLFGLVVGNRGTLQMDWILRRESASDLETGYYGWEDETKIYDGRRMKGVVGVQTC